MRWPAPICSKLRSIGQNDYRVLEGRQRIGRIRFADERIPGVWLWNVQVHLTGGLPRRSNAPFPGTSVQAGRFLRMRIKQSLLLSCVLMAASGVASAQAPPVPATPPAPTAPPSPARAANCAPMQQGPYSGEAAPGGTTTGQRIEPLGDKLARSDGVLCPPPGVDPDMRAPAPDIGNTPVIPPPGSPGVDPTARPK